MVDEMKKVRVIIPFKFYVNYIVEVKNPEDIEEIVDRLEEMGPSEWEKDPYLYERLGEDWISAVVDIKKGDVEIMSTTAP